MLKHGSQLTHVKGGRVRSIVGSPEAEGEVAAHTTTVRARASGCSVGGPGAGGVPWAEPSAAPAVDGKHDDLRGAPCPR